MNLTKELGLTPEEAREEREQTADTHRAFEERERLLAIGLLDVPEVSTQSTS
jgi:hypothetical protein